MADDVAEDDDMDGDMADDGDGADERVSDRALWQDLHRLAGELAVRAGTLMLECRAAGLAVSTKSSSTDLVTDADQAVEQFLIDELGRRRPGDKVLAEEGMQARGSDVAAGRQRDRRPAVRWVIDPIDGTVNFLLGQPQFAVSIAAQVQGRTVAGSVYNPVSGDHFHAVRGSGAFRNETRLTGPRDICLADAVVATGFGYDREHRARQGAAVGALLPQVGNLRRSGSAALDLCAIAAGWVDLYYEGPLNEWDFAAGLLIAEEAGVITSGRAGVAAGTELVAAAHQNNSVAFFELLGQLGV